MNKNETKNKIKKNRPQQKKSNRIVENSNTGKWIWFALAVAGISTFIIYFKATGFGYAWDDDLYIIQNTHIKDLKWENIKMFFTGFYYGNYQPVTILMYALEQKIFKDSSAFLHINNIIIHLINTYLVFVLIRKISPQNAAVALITAAFFAVSPMHVESVAWISERKDVLYTFFFLLSLIMYTRYLKDQNIKQWIYAAVFFILSCLSKSAAVVLPLLMLLLDYYCKRKFSWKMIVEKLPFFAISLIFGIIAFYSQPGASAVAANYNLFERLSIISFSMISYMIKAFIPFHQSAIYPYPLKTDGAIAIQYYFAPLVLAVLIFLIWYSKKWGKEIIFGSLFFVITIILVLQIFPVGDAIMSDRYSYIPYIGVYFLLGKLYEYFSKSEKIKTKYYKKYFIYVLIAGFFIFSMISFQRVKCWQSDETLFLDAQNKYPDASIPCFILGNYYSLHYADGVYVNDEPKREMYLKKALAEDENALRLSTTLTDKVKAYSNLGSVKYKLGDYPGTIHDCDQAIQMDSTYAFAYTNRGCAKHLLKDYKGALTDYNKAIKFNPQEANAIRNRDIVLSILKDSKK